MARELTQEDKDDLTPGELAALMGAPTEEVEATAAEALAAKQAETDAEARAAEKANDKAGSSDEEGRLATPEEIAAAEAAEAALAAAKADPATDEGKTLTAEELAAVLEDETPPAAPKPVTYKGVSDEDYKTEVAKLDAEKAEAMKKLMDGEIDVAAYAVIESSVSEKRDDLVANRTLARANQEAAEQRNAALHAELQVNIGSLMTASKGSAIDYNTDLKAQKQFDSALQVLGADPDNASLSPKQFVAEAHRMVRAMRGVVDTPAAAPAAAKPAPVKRDVPVTLGNVPAAAPNAVGSDIKTQFALLSGEEAEEFLERLPKAQRQALMAGGMV